jgi:superfamily II DNA or RNA helicase
MENLSGKLKIFPWRLGLSATPEREFKEEGNKFIEEEIGPIIYQFTIEDAIQRGILCEFDYTPLFYDLSDEDKERQRAAYARYNNQKNDNPNAKIELYMEFARVRKESKEKIPVFEKYLEKNEAILKNCIIFTETKDYGLLVQKVIHNYLRDYHTYYGEDQKENLQRFAKGEFSTLVTCKAISEGIDIKSVKNIILFSSDRSKLQTTQRIGRALRVDPTDPDKRANIIDFVVEKDFEEEDTDQIPTDKERCEWLTKISKIKRKD